MVVAATWHLTSIDIEASNTDAACAGLLPIRPHLTNRGPSHGLLLNALKSVS